jgi:hypothetical protein
MDRRGFLKNSIGALLFSALSSNKVLSQVVETLTPNSPKVLLYLIQLTNGERKIRATKWVDIPTKRLTEKNIIKDSFKAIEIVDFNDVNKRRLELWKEYNCSGRIGHLVSMGISMTDQMKKEYSDYARKNNTGRIFPETAKKILSEKAKLRPSPNKGKIFSDEVRKRMSEGGKGKKYSDETKEKMKQRMLSNNPFKGKTHTEERKKIISQQKIGNKNCVGRTMSEETRNKIKKSLEGRINIQSNTKSVICYSYSDMTFIKEFNSIRYACNELNLDYECIRLTCSGKRKHTSGYTFRYKEIV